MAQETLYSWLGALRNSAGEPTVRAIESAVGISRTRIADAFAGRNNPTLQTVTAIAIHLARKLPPDPEHKASTIAVKARRLYAIEQHRAVATDHRRRPGRRPGPTVFLLLYQSGAHLVLAGAAADADEAKERAETIHGVAVELPVAIDFRPQPQETEIPE